MRALTATAVWTHGSVIVGYLVGREGTPVGKLAIFMAASTAFALSLYWLARKESR